MEEEPKLFDRSYTDWNPEEVALYVLKHCPDQPDKVVDVVKQVFVESNCNGMAMKAFGDVDKSSPKIQSEWRNVVLKFQFKLELPEVEMQRGTVHPIIATLLDIPKKLVDSNNGIWHTLNSFCRRMERYDSVYKDDEGYWCHDRAGRPYFNPGNWRRYGFFPIVEGETEEQVEDILKNWHVAYHGTKFVNADSIVQFGLVPPGTKLSAKDRNVEIINQRGKAGAKGGKIPIYVTPSIAYASHYLYTSPQKDGDEYVYCVFQVRIRPGSFRIQGNTLWSEGWGDKSIIFDERFGPDELEWLVEDSKDVRVTGLMISREKVEPKKKISDLFQKHKEMTSKPRAEGVGQWYWNCAGQKTLDRKGPWKPYAENENKFLEKAFMKWQAVTYLGKVDTDIGVNPYFVDFYKMEQIRCNDNKLRRAIKREVI